MTFNGGFFSRKLSYEQQQTYTLLQDRLLTLNNLKQEIVNNQESLKNCYSLLASQPDEKCILTPEDKKLNLGRLAASIQKRTESLKILDEQIVAVNNQLAKLEEYLAEDQPPTLTVV